MRNVSSVVVASIRELYGKNKPIFIITRPPSQKIKYGRKAKWLSKDLTPELNDKMSFEEQVLSYFELVLENEKA